LVLQIASLSSLNWGVGVTAPDHQSSLIQHKKMILFHPYVVSQPSEAH
jgi:hypothetical protein